MTQGDRLTSPSNPLVKDVGAAVARGSVTSDGCLVAETFHLLEEALRSNVELQAVLSAESSLARTRDLLRLRPGVRLVVLPDALLGRISATETAQGVITLVRPPAWKLPDLMRETPLVVVLDGVQDPGNAGAILRAAEAFGATGVAVLKGGVNPYNPKSVRASAGSVFRIPLVRGVEGGELRSLLEEGKATVYVAAASGGIPAPEADLRSGCAIVIGSEARGPRAEVWGGAAVLRIPTAAVESLNAAMAAGILLYEARRQRGTSA
jgi:TrmH family RNA methyltransferase